MRSTGPAYSGVRVSEAARLLWLKWRALALLLTPVLSPRAHAYKFSQVRLMRVNGVVPLLTLVSKNPGQERTSAEKRI